MVQAIIKIIGTPSDEPIQQDEEEKKEIIDCDETLDPKIKVDVYSKRYNYSTMRIIGNLRDRYHKGLAFLMHQRIITKYQAWLDLTKHTINENYTTKMERVCKFKCYDGYRIIATLQEHYFYKDTSFSALPLFYRVIKNTRSADLDYYNYHTIEIYSLWYDKDLKANLNEYISSEVEILTKNRLRQTFKLSVLPKNTLENLSDIQEIQYHQEYNTMCLTVKRKHIDESNGQSFTFNTLWMYRDVNIYNANGKYKDELDQWDNTLNESDIILIKVDKIRKAYSKLKWDEDLPDQLNILEYGIGHQFFRSNDKDILSNMSIFYDAQTDSCYLICNRDYYLNEGRSIQTILKKIKDYSTNNTSRITSSTLELSYRNFNDLSEKIEELSRKHFVEIVYMSNLINNVCQLKIYLSHKTIKKRKLDKHTYLEKFNFNTLIESKRQGDQMYNENRNPIKWLDYDTDKEIVPTEMELSTMSQVSTLACAFKLLEHELQLIGQLDVE